MKNKPAYAIDSVDHALYLVTLLHQEGPLGVSDAAARLGVSRSTAHRLLAMLVYRDFAEQGGDRRYHPGSVLRSTEPTWTRSRDIALPHLRALVTDVNETANMQVLAGADSRFIASAECDQVLRVGDRTGRVLPARLSSGGKVLLAALSPGELADRYADQPDIDLARLRRELGVVRKRGFAVNDQRTELGVTAIGVLVPGGQAAVSIALPSARFDQDRLAGWVASLSATAAAIGEQLQVHRAGR